MMDECGASGAPADRLAMLPLPLIPLVAWPQRGETHRDDDAPAERTIGYDAADRAVFCKSRHVLSRVVSADDAEFVEEPALSECLTAWLLRDGGWIVHRSVRRRGGCRDDERSDLYLSATMPG